MIAIARALAALLELIQTWLGSREKAETKEDGAREQREKDAKATTEARDDARRVADRSDDEGVRDELIDLFTRRPPRG